MGRQTPRGNFQREMARAQLSDSALRAAMASMYAAAEAAPVDARNASVVVRLGGDESSSCSSDSESSGSGACSDPYSEPSPPKSIPKPCESSRVARDGRGAFAKTALSASFVRQSATSAEVYEEKPRANQVEPARAATHRFGFSFASSMCTTEGTASHNSSSSSVKIGDAAAATTDDGRLSIAHLTTCDESSEETDTREAVSEHALPPKLTLTLKPVIQASTTEAKPPTAHSMTSSMGETGAPLPMSCFASHSTHLHSSPTSFSPDSHGPRPHSGRVVLEPRRASLPGLKITDKSTTGSTMGLFCSEASRACTTHSQVPARPSLNEVCGLQGPTSSLAGISSRPVSHPVNCASPSVDQTSQATKEAPTSTIANTSSPPRAASRRASGAGFMFASETSTLSTSSLLQSDASYRSTDVKPSTSGFTFGVTPDSIRDNGSVPRASPAPDEANHPSTSKFEPKPTSGDSRAQNETISDQSTPREEATSSRSTTSWGLFGSPISNEHQPPKIPRAGFSFGLFGNSSAKSVFSARTTLSSLVVEISEASRVACGRTSTIYKTMNGASILAVKVVNKPVGKHASSRFEREMIALQNLPDHPSLVRHHGYLPIIDGDKVGVITDMVAGSQTLHDRLHSEFSLLDEKGKHSALLQISDALAFLHSRGVTHRDLTLKHVLHSFGSSPGTIKVINFGLPTLRGSNSSDNRQYANSWMDVTPQYASPEVLRGELSCHDNNGWMMSDVFSFAVLMVELLSEEHPWDGESPTYITNAILKRGERAFDISGVRVFGKKSADLDALIREAWHDDPSRRPNANDLHKRLEALLSHGQTGDKAGTNDDPFASISRLFQVDNPSVRSQQAAMAPSPIAVETMGSPSDRGSGITLDELNTSATQVQATSDADQVFSTPDSGPAVSNSTASHSKFGLPRPSQSSDLPFRLTTPRLFSTSSYNAARSAPKPVGFSPGSSAPAQYGFSMPRKPNPSNVFSFPSISPYSSLSGLTLTISDKARIAMGKRGVIYRASHREGHVAVEVVNKPQTKSARSRLDKEILALKNLPEHPHLVRHYGSTPLGDGNQCGIITDLVFGAKSVESRLHQSVCRIEEVQKHRMLLQIVDAVAYLHAHGITHRDLSLENVLSTYDSPPMIKLVNFGLPTLRGTTINATASPANNLTGSTLQYASPEVLRGDLSSREDESWDKSNGGWVTRNKCSTESKHGWRESDVYSLAVLLVEMILEEKPWDGELPMYVMNAVAKHGSRPFKLGELRVFGRESPALEALIHEAWHDDPAKRPTAHGLKVRLERIFNAG